MTASVNVSNSYIEETTKPQAQANHRHAFDVVIVGSGGAGLSLALSLPSHLSIAVLAKDSSLKPALFMPKAAWQQYYRMMTRLMSMSMIP